MKAMQEFWMNEDLLELLLSMLDLASILALASVCPLALELIKRPLVWHHLLRTSWQLILKDSFDVELVTGLLKDDEGSRAPATRLSGAYLQKVFTAWFNASWRAQRGDHVAT